MVGPTESLVGPFESQIVIPSETFWFVCEPDKFIGCPETLTGPFQDPLRLKGHIYYALCI